jgi:hypothetical protein
MNRGVAQIERRADTDDAGQLSHVAAGGSDNATDYAESQELAEHGRRRHNRSFGQRRS